MRNGTQRVTPEFRSNSIQSSFSRTSYAPGPRPEFTCTGFDNSRFLFSQHRKAIGSDEWTEEENRKERGASIYNGELNRMLVLAEGSESEEDNEEVSLS